MRKLALLLGLTAALAAQAQTITITPQTQTYGYHSYRVQIQGLNNNSNQTPVYVAPPAPIYVPNPQQFIPQPALRISPEVAMGMLQASNQAPQQPYVVHPTPDVKVQALCMKFPGVDKPSCVEEQKPAAKTCADVAEEYRKWCKE